MTEAVLFTPVGDPPECPTCGRAMGEVPPPGPEVKHYARFRCVPCIREGRRINIILNHNPNYAGGDE